MDATRDCCTNAQASAALAQSHPKAQRVGVAFGAMPTIPATTSSQDDNTRAIAAGKLRADNVNTAGSALNVVR